MLSPSPRSDIRAVCPSPSLALCYLPVLNALDQTHAVSHSALPKQVGVLAHGFRSSTIDTSVPVFTGSTHGSGCALQAPE